MRCAPADGLATASAAQLDRAGFSKSQPLLGRLATVGADSNGLPVHGRTIGAGNRTNTGGDGPAAIPMVNASNRHDYFALEAKGAPRGSRMAAGTAWRGL